MVARQSDKSKALYDAHARLTGTDDLHLQVWRSVNGKPIGEDQIGLIVSAIECGLQLDAESRLIEIACGNGAISQHFIEKCECYVGVDVSECLISVAKERFETPPRIRFFQGDALDFLRRGAQPKIYNRMLCYAALQYFPDEMVVSLLDLLRRRFINVSRVFIGNMPDIERASLFFGGEMPKRDTLESNETPIGIWRSQDQVRALCEAAGWRAFFSRMPGAFYASAYRFDAVLVRRLDFQP